MAYIVRVTEMQVRIGTGLAFVLIALLVFFMVRYLKKPIKPAKPKADRRPAPARAPRPEREPRQRRQPPPPEPSRGRPMAPDDDIEFLRSLNRPPQDNQ